MDEVVDTLGRLAQQRVANHYLFAAFHVLVPLLFVVERWGPRLDAWSRERLGLRSITLRALFFVAVYETFYWALLVLLRWMRVYYPEHAAGVRHDSVARWLGLNGVQFILYAASMALLAVLALWFIRRWPRRWWLALAAVYPFCMAVQDIPWPRWIDPGMVRETPLEDPRLAASIHALALRAGLPAPAVMVAHASTYGTEAGAAIGGHLGPPRIVLDDNLLAALEHDEVLHVVAHELAHYAHRDPWRAAAGDAVGGLVVLALAAWMLPPLLRRFGPAWQVRSLSEPGALPLLLAAAIALGITIEPLGNWLARERERAADRFAVALLDNGPACRRAIVKVLGPAENESLAALVFSSHPFVSERLALCDERRVSRP